MDFYVQNKIQFVMIWQMVIRMTRCIFLRCERELQLRRAAQGEREPSLERQCLECQVSSSRSGSETHFFSSPYGRGVFSSSLLSIPFFQPPSCLPISSSLSNISENLSVCISLFSHAN